MIPMSGLVGLCCMRHSMCTPVGDFSSFLRWGVKSNFVTLCRLFWM